MVKKTMIMLLVLLAVACEKEEAVKEVETQVEAINEGE